MGLSPFRQKMIPFRAIAWTVVAALGVAPAFAQKNKPPAGPRAVAVVESTSEGLRLVPISLMSDGRYYDATLYRANPIPMALDRDTVYEVQSSGQPLGDFTVTLAGQMPNGSWVGQGKYESEADRKKQAEERAKASAAGKNPAPAQDERPVLRRGSSKPSSDSGQEQPANPTPAPAAPVTTPEQSAAPAVTKADTDDSNRPILKRGNPAEEQAQKIQEPKLPHKAQPKPPEGLNKVQVAVSDATKTDTHPYTWKWANPEEEQKFRSDAQKLALKLVHDYANKVRGPKPEKLELLEFRAFDLAYNNEPQIILTARVTPAVPAAAAKNAPGEAPSLSGFQYYVTVVATENIYNELEKIFASVTDNKHLDAFPRYELIDAVDADGNGAGDLLFRRISDLSSSFALYRVIGTRVDELLTVPAPRGY